MATCSEELQNDEMCDATKDDRSVEARHQTKTPHPIARLHYQTALKTVHHSH